MRAAWAAWWILTAGADTGSGWGGDTDPADTDPADTDPGDTDDTDGELDTGPTFDSADPVVIDGDGMTTGELLGEEGGPACAFVNLPSAGLAGAWMLAALVARRRR